MSSIFWEMWNENHGEIDEKVWVNQKNKKIKDEIGVCYSYLIEAEKHNAKRDEESQNRDQLIPNQSCAIMYLIDDRRALWDFLDRQALWDFYTFSVSGFQRESDIVFVGYVLGYLFKFCCGLFSRAENFFIFYQGLWAEKCKRFSTKLACFFFFFNISYKGVLTYFEGPNNLWNKV